jgi:hypothetical protein
LEIVERVGRLGALVNPNAGLARRDRIVATIPLPDYTNRDISEEPVYGPAEGAVLAEVSSGG